jgi:putative redox protein
MAVRMYADRRGIPLRGIETKVSLDRSDSETVVFHYELKLEGPLTAPQRDELLRSAAACPVRRTLSKAIRFESNLEPARS